jgi:hypothetical protein
MSYGVLTAVNIKIVMFSGVIPCRYVDITTVQEEPATSIFTVVNATVIHIKRSAFAGDRAAVTPETVF